MDMNKEVRYELHRGSGEVFAVDRLTGDIRLKQTLGGLKSEYELLVSAYDKGKSVLYSILGVNVLAPMFSQGARFIMSHILTFLLSFLCCMEYELLLYCHYIEKIFKLNPYCTEEEGERNMGVLRCIYSQLVLWTFVWGI